MADMKTSSRSLPSALCRALAFGLLFIPLTLLFYFIAFWIDSPWSPGWRYEHVGFPCITLFAIMSASFFLSQAATYQFSKSFLVIMFLSLLVTAICGALDLTPIPYKSAKVVHWQRPVFIAWMVIPPWTTAIVGVVLLRLLNRNEIKAKPIKSA